MTVKELIAELQDQDANAEVRVGYEYGDNCHTTVAARVLRVGDVDVTDSPFGELKQVAGDDDRGRDCASVVLIEGFSA